MTLVPHGARSWNADAIVFGPSTRPWTVKVVAVFDAATGGNCWILGRLDEETTVPVGQTFIFDPSALVFALTWE